MDMIKIFRRPKVRDLESEYVKLKDRLKAVYGPKEVSPDPDLFNLLEGDVSAFGRNSELQFKIETVKELLKNRKLN